MTWADFRPLLFVFWRSLFNGLKRILVSPKRLLGVLFLVVWQGWWVFQSLWVSSNRPSRRMPQLTELPKVEILDTIVFAIFAAICFFAFIGMNMSKGQYKKADVDTLFPTPVSAKAVMTMKILTGVFASLILPLLGAFFFYRSSVSAQMVGPQFAGYALSFRIAMVSVVIMSAFWTVLGMFVSVRLGRSDEQTRKLSSRFNWAMGIFVLLVFAAVGAALVLRTPVSVWKAVAESPITRVLIFPAEGATLMSLAPVQGSIATFLLGLAIIVVPTYLVYRLALRQSGYLYDQVALVSNALTNSSAPNRPKNMTEIAVTSAQKGKLKLRGQWLSRFKFSGEGAILWRSMIDTMRSSSLNTFIVYLIAYVPAVIMLAIPNSSNASNQMIYSLVLMGIPLALVLFVLFGTTAQNFSAFLQMNDTVKPIPIPPQKVIRSEILGQFLPFMPIGILISIGLIIARPDQWWYGLTQMFIMPPTAFLAMAGGTIVSLLFPDPNDVTQRGFRGIIFMFATLILVAPAAIMFLGGFVVGLSPILIGITVGLLHAILGLIFTMVAGLIYSRYEPLD